MAAGLAFTAVGCSSSSNSTSQNSNQPADYVAGVSLDKPIKVDKEAGTITVLTKINGKYFDEATRHNSVEQSGTMVLNQSSQHLLNQKNSTML